MPKTLYNCLQLVGISSPAKPLRYLSPNASCDADTMQPSRVQECTSNLHLRKLILKPACVSASNARRVACQHCYQVTPYVFKLSRKARTPSKSWSIESMINWKQTGSCYGPKGIRTHLNSPSYVVMPSIFWVLGIHRMLWYPALISIAESTWAPEYESSISRWLAKG